MPATTTPARQAADERPPLGTQAEHRALHRIVVPVDGSPFSEGALPVAAWAGRSLLAPLHLVEVVATGAAPERAIHYLDDLARRLGAASWNVARGDDPGWAIIVATHLDHPALACLATHGRGRSAAALGSVVTRVLDRATEPVMLVGPKARPPCANDAPVIVAVDGGPGDPAVVEVGAEWAARLARPLVVATVAEPVPPSFRESRPMRRARGPQEPEAYLAQLVANTVEAGTEVDACVVYDPINVRAGVLRLVDRTAGLLVLGTHRRTRPLRALLGSHAARIIHDVEVPALVVPLDPGG